MASREGRGTSNRGLERKSNTTTSTTQPARTAHHIEAIKINPTLVLEIGPNSCVLSAVAGAKYRYRGPNHGSRRGPGTKTDISSCLAGRFRGFRRALAQSRGSATGGRRHYPSDPLANQSTHV